MIKKTISSVICASLLCLGALALSSGADTTTANNQDSTDENRAAIIAEQAPSYPLNVCLISGEKFTKESPAVDVVVSGQLIRTCCNNCAAKVKKEPATFIEKVHKAVIKEQKSLWPLKTCPVSGEAYGGDMGDPLDHVVGTRYVKLCCKGCLRAIKKDPTKFLAKLDALVMPELIKSYPLETCIVSGKPLDSKGTPVDLMYGHRVLRFCCKGCLRAYNKNPAGIAQKVYASAASKKAK